MSPFPFVMILRAYLSRTAAKEEIKNSGVTAAALFFREYICTKAKRTLSAMVIFMSLHFSREYSY